MSADLRAVVYPLSAVHQRERWALDALQADLALAARRVAASGEACAHLRACHRMASQDTAPAADVVIDPLHTQARLHHLADLQHRLVRCRSAHVALEQAQRRLLDASQRQQMKLETIERHRAAFVRDVVRQQERQRSAEVDREWLARSQWRRVFALDEPGAGRGDGTKVVTSRREDASVAGEAL